jgi:hypothetical protein
MHAQKCSVTTAEGSTFDGHVDMLGPGTPVCYYSPEAELYDGDEYGDRFPPLETRECCSTTEFLFHRALWNQSTEIYSYFMLVISMLICLNHFQCIARALQSWNNWKQSSRYVMMSCLFPFVLKFIAFSIPAYDAQQVDAAQV